MTPEGKVKAAVKREIAKFGKRVYTHWPVQTGFGAPTLDCIGAIRSALVRRAGVAFAVETKAPGQHLTARQELTKEHMEAGGICVFVVGERDDAAPPYRYSGLEELVTWLKAHS